MSDTATNATAAHASHVIVDLTATAAPRARAFACTTEFESCIGELEVLHDGTVSFSPSEQAASIATDSFCACRAPPLSHFSGSDVIGATLCDGNTAAVKIWHCPSQTKAGDKVFRSLKQSQPFICEDPASADVLCNAIRKAACPAANMSTRGLPKVLGIVNPKSGKAESAAVARAVGPILIAAGIQMDVVETTGPGHASIIAKEMVTAEHVAIMLFGGDGTVHEVLQGLAHCDDWEARIQVPLCHVPAGSGNGLSASCGLWSPITAAHAMIKGTTSRMDAATLYQPSQRKRLLLFLGITWAFIATVDISTEPLRWLLGGERFTYGALKELASMKKHAARFAWVLDSTRDVVLQQGKHQDGISPSAADNLASACAATWGPRTPILDQLGSHPPDMSNSAAWPSGWSHSYREDILFFNLAGPKWQALDFQLNPNGKHSDGAWELAVDKGITRRQGLDLLLKAADGSHKDAQYLDVSRVVAFAMEPLSEGTWLVADGEVLEYETIYVEVHQALLNVVVAPHLAM